MERDEPIFCVNNCGFFGSPATHNLCSKCFKDFLLKQRDTSKVFDESTVGVVVDDGDGKLRVVKGVEEGKVVEESSSENGGANRCSSCRKRVGLTGFKCRCGQTFCSIHRYSDKHNCVFDYKGAAQDAIAKANPVVKSDKVEKI